MTRAIGESFKSTLYLRFGKKYYIRMYAEKTTQFKNGRGINYATKYGSPKF